MVKLRLKRMGSKFNAFYRIVAADSRSPRDGRFIEELGYYNPHTKETFVDKNLRTKWEDEGAVPSATVKNLFKKYDKVSSKCSVEGIVTLDVKPKKSKKQEEKTENTTSNDNTDQKPETKKESSKANDSLDNFESSNQKDESSEDKTEETIKNVVSDQPEENSSSEESTKKD